jgi:hypothetical protein
LPARFTSFTVNAVNVPDLSGRPLAPNPLDTPLFVDRERELALIRRSVDSRTNVLVLGPRGSGKTSLLRFAEAAISSYHPTVYVEASVAPTPEGLLELLRWRLLPRTTPSYGYETMPESQQLLELVQSLAAVGEPDDPTVLILDEPRSPEIILTLFGRLRDEVWRLPIIWIVSSSASRAALLRPPTDAFFGSVVNLEPLDPDRAHELLRRRVGEALTDQEIDQLVEAAGGHPRRLLNLAREFLLGDASQSEIAAFEQRKRDVLARLGEPAERVLELVEGFGAISASDPEILTRLGWTRNRATQVLNQLEREGLLSSSFEKGGRRKFYELIGPS